MVKMCAESGFVDVVGCHTNLVVARLEVKFGEEWEPWSSRRPLMRGDCEFLFDSEEIEGVVVDAKPLSAIMLLEKHKR